MDARVVSKELMELEKSKTSFLESNFLVYKEEEEDKTVQMKNRKKMKRGGMDDKEEGKQQTMTSIPTSQVLGKVKDFLGVTADANEKLQRSAQENGRVEFDIEVLSGTEKEYIEMVRRSLRNRTRSRSCRVQGYVRFGQRLTDSSSRGVTFPFDSW